MSDQPTDIVQQSLDAIGIEREIGDLTDGSRESRVLLRAYRECRKQLLRAAHWDFARKEAPLLLLADGTGQTEGAGSIVPGPFRFAYAYPDDCVKVRSVPLRHHARPAGASDLITLPVAPLFTGLEPGFAHGRGRREHSARFIVTTDVNNPPAPGQITDLSQGVSPQGRTAILTDAASASAVYTFDALHPENWDPLFRAALVSYIASDVAMALHGPKTGAAVRAQQIALTKSKIEAARVADGNEGVTTTDHTPDFIRGRYGPGADRLGGSWFGERYDTLGFSDGSLC